MKKSLSTLKFWWLFAIILSGFIFYAGYKVGVGKGQRQTVRSLGNSLELLSLGAKGLLIHDKNSLIPIESILNGLDSVCNERGILPTAKDKQVLSNLADTISIALLKTIAQIGGHSQMEYLEVLEKYNKRKEAFSKDFIENFVSQIDTTGKRRHENRHHLRNTSRAFANSLQNSLCPIISLLEPSQKKTLVSKLYDKGTKYATKEGKKIIYESAGIGDDFPLVNIEEKLCDLIINVSFAAATEQLLEVADMKDRCSNIIVEHSRKNQQKIISQKEYIETIMNNEIERYNIPVINIPLFSPEVEIQIQANVFLGVDVSSFYAIKFEQNRINNRWHNKLVVSIPDIEVLAIELDKQYQVHHPFFDKLSTDEINELNAKAKDLIRQKANSKDLFLQARKNTIDFFEDKLGLIVNNAKGNYSIEVEFLDVPKPTSNKINEFPY